MGGTYAVARPPPLSVGIRSLLLTSLLLVPLGCSDRTPFDPGGSVDTDTDQVHTSSDLLEPPAHVELRLRGESALADAWKDIDELRGHVSGSDDFFDSRIDRGAANSLLRARIQENLDLATQYHKMATAEYERWVAEREGIEVLADCPQVAQDSGPGGPVGGETVAFSECEDENCILLALGVAVHAAGVVGTNLAIQNYCVTNYNALECAASVTLFINETLSFWNSLQSFLLECGMSWISAALDSFSLSFVEFINSVEFEVPFSQQTEWNMMMEWLEQNDLLGDPS